MLLAILLIFFYLLYEVLPLFGNASLVPQAQFEWRLSQSEPMYLAMEEQGEIGFAIDASGMGTFFDLETGELRRSIELGQGRGDLTAVAHESTGSHLLALGHRGGEVSLVKHNYRLSYPDGQRVISPTIDFPYAENRIVFGPQAIDFLAVRDSEEALVIAAQMADGQLLVQRYNKEVDFLSEEVKFVLQRFSIPSLTGEIGALHIGTDQRWLYRIDTAGNYSVIDLQAANDSSELSVVQRGALFERSGKLVASELLLGGISLLATSDNGELAQFFMSRTPEGHQFQLVRSFDTQGVVLAHILPEHRRKGFLGLSDQGELLIFHSTAHRTLLREEIQPESTATLAAISPRGNKLLVFNRNGQVRTWEIDNDHPDISWSALWQKVWYESYEEPEYVWQSSASNNDFEPKYSFSPLAFGTLKAAFYTMLIAAPLGICGAIYTAYFMAPVLRRKVKPLIELMEALPTVILGFLAGLWLAPFVEDHLTGVFAVLLIVPIGVLVFAFCWSKMPLRWRSVVPDGWHAVVLVPVVFALGYLSFAGNDAMELWLFGGDMRVWITAELGISFDQRNALIVGIAMGMAVIPTIFSITEDAIFAVPRHLSYGSLALGATPWQTLVGVVLPTASPGIFSALMIGMGRAVGETMIVLMATGNTPIMDANIFEGMRTLAANIAVEIPEAEVDSTHYRVLFLAAFVLFLFTFMLNTAAELVRQRLRIKYGSL